MKTRPLYFSGYAEQDYDVVIGHGYEFVDVALSVGINYPDTIFLVSSTGISQGANVGSFSIDTTEQGFIQGVVAGVTTESNYVGSIVGIEIPPIVNVLVGFKAGALYANPNTDYINMFSGSFDDAAKSKELAFSIIDNGVDVIMGDPNKTGLGALEACAERGIKYIGSTGEANIVDPETVAAAGIQNYPLAMVNVVGLITSNEWEPKNYSYGITDGVVYLSELGAFNDLLTDSQIQEIENIINKIMQGEIDIAELTKDRDYAASVNN